jgi:UDP-N-acetylglucosamine 2-epimerase (non-hydrolysing)
MKIILVAGARPNFVKIAPLMWELEKQKKKHPELEYLLVHTGQHYDKNMSDSFFEDLEIPDPNYNLGVGGGTHAEQTAKILVEFEKVCMNEKPDIVLVVGDVNSTIACALVAQKLNIKVAHVEAGLRSFDRNMPEEINRLMTDVISDYLFITEKSGMQNLKKEGVPKDKIFFVGNVMIDSLIHIQKKLDHENLLQKMNIEKHKFAVMTLHRPSNVDSADELKKMLGHIKKIQDIITVVWPMHPRTLNNLKKYGLEDELKQMPHLIITEPLGYKEFMVLLHDAKCVLTDSGGIQEETTYLGVPCLTLRNNTERPSTITEGTNILLGQDWDRAYSEMKKIVEHNEQKPHTIPKYWDGKAAKRIIKILIEGNEEKKTKTQKIEEKESTEEIKDENKENEN